MPGRTLFEKIWTQHVAAELSGDLSLLSIDRHFLHDLEGGPNFIRLEKLGYQVHDPDLTYAMPDHAISSLPGRTADTNPMGGRLLRDMRRGANAAGVKLFDIGDDGQGIVHVAGPEMGSTCRAPRSFAPTVIPAPTALSVRSPSLSARARWPMCSRHKRYGRKSRRQCAFAWRVRRAPGVTAKEVILATIGQFGTAVGRGHALEFAGSLVDALTIESVLPYAICRSN